MAELHVGIPIPRYVGKQIHEWARRQPWPEGTELEHPTDHHITLLYTPEGYEHKDASWINHLDRAKVRLNGLKSFPAQEKGHAYVLGVDSPEIEEHANELQQKAKWVGLDVPEYEGGFKPHITVGYGPSPQTPRVEAPEFEFDAGPSEVSSPRPEPAKTADYYSGDIPREHIERLTAFPPSLEPSFHEPWQAEGWWPTSPPEYPNPSGNLSDIFNYLVRNVGMSFMDAEEWLREHRPKLADYYHVAPTEDRARIQQHGLQPSRPVFNPVWGPNREETLQDQPEAVYVWEGYPWQDDQVDPFEIRQDLHRDLRENPELSDIWRIPHNDAPTVQPDWRGGENARRIPHVVYPQLAEGGPEVYGPWPKRKAATKPLYHWMDRSALHQWMDPAYTGPGETWLTEHGDDPHDFWNPDVPQMEHPVRLTIDPSHLNPEKFDAHWEGWENNHLYRDIIPPEAISDIKSFKAPEDWFNTVPSPEDHWPEWGELPPDEKQHRNLNVGEDWAIDRTGRTAKVADYYHVAPTEERERIKQHGLIPSDPYREEPEAWFNSYGPDYQPPTGVYGWPTLDKAREWIDQVPEGQGMEYLDTWKFPGQGLEDPDQSGGYYLPHRVDPELIEGPEHRLQIAKVADYYHIAPTEDRARIRQHGLQPSIPARHPKWEEMGSWIQDQPEGVYVTDTSDPTVSEHWGEYQWDKHQVPRKLWDKGPSWDWRPERFDVWRVPADQLAHEPNEDPMIDEARIIPHTVYPEFVEGGPEVYGPWPTRGQSVLTDKEFNDAANALR